MGRRTLFILGKAQRVQATDMMTTANTSSPTRGPGGGQGQVQSNWDPDPGLTQARPLVAQACRRGLAAAREAQPRAVSGDVGRSPGTRAAWALVNGF